MTANTAMSGRSLSGQMSGQPLDVPVSIGLRPMVRQPAAAAIERRRFVAPLAILIVWALAWLFGWIPLSAGAQERPIPPEAKLGTLKIGHFPDAVLDGRAIRLGPGTRIRDTQNRLVVPSNIQGTALVIAYVTGSLGEIVSVWILTDAEFRQLRARRPAA